MRYKVLFTNVLIEPIEEEQNKETIILPDQLHKKIRGTVKETGRGMFIDGRLTPMEVRPEMIVHFYPDDAKEIDINGKIHYILNQSDILLIEED